MEPVLIGPARQIHAIAFDQGLQIDQMEVIDAGEDPAAAAEASVELCQKGRAQILMKGSLHTGELMAAVVARESGLRTARRVSHAFVFDIPSYPKPLSMTDCVVNITLTPSPKSGPFRSGVFGMIDVFKGRSCREEIAIHRGADSVRAEAAGGGRAG
jgi:phosphotransacetylase